MQTARRRVFCASLADVFDNEVDSAWRADLFALIEATPNLDWLLLTKRIGNVAKMAPVSWVGGPVQHGPDPANIHGGWPANVWLGATICNQAEADRDIPKLLATRAAVKFLSMEPLLEPIDLTRICPTHFAATANVLTGKWMWDGGPTTQENCHIDWVIVGGESGPQARPMHPDWVRSLRDQCAAAGVPFMFKQWGEWGPDCIPPVHDSYRWPIETGQQREGVWSYRVGKKAAGRVLDGVEHSNYPKATA